MSNTVGSGQRNVGWFAITALLVLMFSAPFALAQSTISTGSIQGTVTDPSGAVVANATVTITNTGTAQKIVRTTNETGAYSSGPLSTGQYVVRVEGKGFQTVETPVHVQVGNTATANAKLQLGAETQVVEVTGENLSVNTEQATVQGVLTATQIESLPVNGRNFLDLAQLEPGVQIQDGGNFDPTKNGMSSVSFGGRSGRAARITVDGLDISDENVGTTTQNISAGAISEFQISQSTLDLSTELTSSGSVNVVTKTGTNAVHGDGFYLFRDKNAGLANFPGGKDLPLQRNHFGGSLGGPVVKNNLFFFLNAERVKQDQQNPVTPLSQFVGVPAGYAAPFRDNVTFGRLDWNGPRGLRMFYKFAYHWNQTIRSDAETYQPFQNKNNTPSHGIGADFTTGPWSHSLRYGYLYFSNAIQDAVIGNSGLYNPVEEWNIALRVGPVGTPMRFGPNRLAPQATFQRNNQLKYDGSRMLGSHLIRFGVDYNKIDAGGLASFYGVAPELRTSNNSAAIAAAEVGPFPGGASNPLNYQVNRVVLGNGQGFASERAAFNLPGGGFFSKRLGLYFGDSWKMLPNLTVTAGVRYSRDSGRAPSDIDPITCDQIDSTLFSSVPCTGNAPLMEQWGAGLGDRVRQDNNNWGPQLGVAWDPTRAGKTVIRAGAGLYYENNVFNNILFDRGLRLKQGLFNVVPQLCGPFGFVLPVPGVGNVTGFSYNGGTVNFQNDLCGKTVGEAAPIARALQDFYQQATITAGPQGNSLFIGNTLGAFAGFVAPNYRSPYSYQMNAGIQHQVRPNMILSADLIRNVSVHYLVSYDANQVGNVKYFNKTAAQNAVAATLAACGVGSIDAAIASCPGLHPGGGGASIVDFANHGLDSGAQYLGGLPASAFGLTPDQGAAFGGRNGNVGTGNFLFPDGRSTYTALQLRLQQNTTRPLPGLRAANYQVSYSLSRFNSMIGADQDFAGLLLDQENSGRYYGPATLDRTHQLSFGTTLDIARGPQISFIGHILSPLAVTATLPLDPSGSAGEIFRTDLTGDGTTADVLPGTNIGSYGRDFNGSGINGAINQYNNTIAGTLTPAGQVLVDNGLFSAAQLQALGGVATAVPLAPGDQLKMSWMKTVDMRVEWPIRLSERVTLRPSVAMFNLFNFANYNPNTTKSLLGSLAGESPSINGTSKSSTLDVDALRTNVGTGTNAFGAPRQMEFGLRMVF